MSPRNFRGQNGNVGNFSVLEKMTAQNNEERRFKMSPKELDLLNMAVVVVLDA